MKPLKRNLFINSAAIIIVMILFASAAPLFSQNIFDNEPEVRVRIILSEAPVKFSFLGEWNIETEDGSTVMEGEGINSIFAEDGNIEFVMDEQIFKTRLNDLTLFPQNVKSNLLIKDVPYGVGWWWEGKEDRIYEGKISFHVSEKNLLSVVVSLPLEQYLKGVVPYEMGGDSPLEALKAQAVAARSEAVIALQSDLYSGKYHDLTSDVECQVFSGNKRRTENSDRAVEETRGLIISENGEPMNAYYASNCGGHSELISNVWPDRKIYDSYNTSGVDQEDYSRLDLSIERNFTEWVNSSPEVYCNPALGTELPAWSQKNFRWNREFTSEEITKNLPGNKNFKSLENIISVTRGKSGRIIEADFIFKNGVFNVKGELAIRQLFSPSLRSSAFIVLKNKNNFILKGAGWGHGVGMCQSGAVAMAKNGTEFKKILQHYYKKAEIISIYKN